MNFDFIRKYFSQGHIWPSIDFELEEYKHLLKGKVLNAGAGTRSVDHLINGELINQDLEWENEEREHIDIYSPLHEIPVDDNYFDAIICIAVLEHVHNPIEIVKEFHRVLKNTGNLIISVPFLQPEHKSPADYQRYTKDGLIHLLNSNGFTVLEIKNVYNVYYTFYWIVYEWLNLKRSFFYKIMKVFILLPLGIAAKYSSFKSDKLASAFKLHAKKNN